MMLEYCVMMIWTPLASLSHASVLCIQRKTLCAELLRRKCEAMISMALGLDAAD
jgi:hypothetical protein